MKGRDVGPCTRRGVSQFRSALNEHETLRPYKAGAFALLVCKVASQPRLTHEVHDKCLDGFNFRCSDEVRSRQSGLSTCFEVLDQFVLRHGILHEHMFFGQTDHGGEQRREYHGLEGPPRLLACGNLSPELLMLALERRAMNAAEERVDCDKIMVDEFLRRLLRW